MVIYDFFWFRCKLNYQLSYSRLIETKILKILVDLVFLDISRYFIPIFGFRCNSCLFVCLAMFVIIANDSKLHFASV